MAETTRAATAEEVRAAEHLFDCIVARHKDTGDLGSPDDMVELWGKCLAAVTAAISDG